MTSDLGTVATTAHRIAVLLGAGVAPPRAWALVSDEPEPAAGELGLERVAGRAGESGLEADAWRAVAAAWSVASDVGAPLAPALRDIASGLRSLADARRDADVALAGPAASARVVLLLPVLGLVLSAALGMGAIEVLVASPIGWACIAVGALLLVVARWWTRRLVRSAQPDDATPGLSCDLMAIAVSGGSSLGAARAAVAAAAGRFGIAAGGAEVDDVLDLAERAGAPAAELLRAEAEERRRDASARARQAAARLASTLMLPLGLCVLPAFLVLGVVPLLLAVLSSTVGAIR